VSSPNILAGISRASSPTRRSDSTSPLSSHQQNVLQSRSLPASRRNSADMTSLWTSMQSLSLEKNKPIDVAG